MSESVPEPIVAPETPSSVEARPRDSSLIISMGHTGLTGSLAPEAVGASDPGGVPISRVVAKRTAQRAAPPLSNVVSKRRASLTSTTGDADRAVYDAHEGSIERRLPSFGLLRPEGRVAKTLVDGMFDLRISSQEHHQDGLAYNQRTETAVVCDGMGGVGVAGEVKDNFGFALSHAVAELDDISNLEDPDTVKAVIERSKQILKEDLGIDVRASGARYNSGDLEWGSTISAVQRVAKSNRWRAVTIGDSSIAVLSAEGKIEYGFGEAFQALRRGDIGSDGTAEEGPLRSKVGMAKGSLDGYVRYEYLEGRAEFAEIELKPGQKIVIVSDAYIQKTSPAILERDARLTAEQWRIHKPTYGDDTTMAIIG